MFWNECKSTRLAKETAIDLDLIHILIQSANNKNKCQMQLPLSEASAGSKISLAYDCVREKLEALAIKNGWRIYNHECYCSFLAEVIKEPELGNTFNELREIRNKINYYGKIVSLSNATKHLNELGTLSKKIDLLLQK